MIAVALGIAALLLFVVSGIFEPTKRDPFSGWAAAVRSVGSVVLAGAVLLAAM